MLQYGTLDTYLTSFKTDRWMDGVKNLLLSSSDLLTPCSYYSTLYYSYSYSA